MNWKAWLHGLGAAVISAFAGALCGMATLPTVFNFTHDGMINVAKLTLGPAVWAGAAYLKQSPLPGVQQLTQTSTTTNSTVEVKKEN